MMKFASGIIVGFFLAVGLMFGLVHVYATPYYGAIKSAEPYVQETYTLTHSQDYTEAQKLASEMNDAAQAIAALPLIGGTVEDSKVPYYTQMAMELMQNVKQSSEATLRMVEWTLFVLENTLTVIFVSLVMVIAGCVMYYNEAAPQKKAKAAPAAKRKRRK